jgi:hypothetical protein
MKAVLCEASCVWPVAKPTTAAPSADGIDSTGNVHVEMCSLVGRDYDRGSYVLASYVGLGLRQLRNDLRGVSSSSNMGYR